jgi:hypothetical protein
VTAEEFFDGSSLGLAAFNRLVDLFADTRPGVTSRTSTSQVTFRLRRGFAYLWRPTQYLRGPAAEVVLTIALREELTSQRFKEITHPTRGVWMHHLEIRSLADVDAEVEHWLLQAADEAK